MSNIIHIYPDRVEAIGAAIGHDLIDNLLTATTQAQALGYLVDSLQALFETQGHHQEAAIGGYAVALVNVLELGIQHLPRLIDDGHIAASSLHTGPVYSPATKGTP